MVLFAIFQSAVRPNGDHHVRGFVGTVEIVQLVILNQGSVPVAVVMGIQEYIVTKVIVVCYFIFCYKYQKK